MRNALAFVALFAAAAAAQSLAIAQPSVIVSVSPASVLPGGTAVVTLAYVDSAISANIAGVEWANIGLPAGVVTTNPTSSVASKVLSCGPVACILAGTGSPLNATVIGSGVIATIPITIGASVAPGTINLALSGLKGATAAGAAAAIQSIGAVLTVASKYDLNGDGLVNMADVQIMLTQAENGTCTAPSSGVGEGQCVIDDVLLEILAALGVIH